MSTTRIDGPGLAALRRDLAAISKDAQREATKAIKTAAEPIRKDASRRAPRSAKVPSGRKTLTGRPSTLHLADSLKVSVTKRKVSIRSTLPHARIVHWGGRHPVFGNRDIWVTVKPNPFIQDAADDGAEKAAEEITASLERLALKHGFHR